MIKIAINGFGRIGRQVFKKIVDEHPNLEIAAINDLTDVKTLAHLLKYDSTYGIYQKTIETDTDKKELSVDGRKIKVFKEKDPLQLPWRQNGIDVVLECTGFFTNYEGAKKHLEAGAKKVVISAPSKDPDKIPSYILGVNAEKFDSEKDKIIDMGSCTTNCLAPIIKIIQDNFGIKKGFMTTVHSYTNDQRILDLAHSDLRRARTASLNIIPTTTGATKVIGNIIPELKGKLNGIAFRVPTASVSILDLICEIEKETTKQELNDIFKKASKERNFEKILKVIDDPLVSSDFIGDPFSAIIDSSLTMTIGNLVKIIAWYDNEWGYSCRLAEFVEYISKK